MRNKTYLLSRALVLMPIILGGCAVSPPTRFTQSRSADHFTPCSWAPHCVSSQASPDSSRHVDAFSYTGSLEHARQTLLYVLQHDDSARVITNKPRFMHATFHTTMGFIDDVTFIFDAQDKRIDVKSSARLGFYDFGVNRRRVEHLRRQFNERVDAAPGN